MDSWMSRSLIITETDSLVGTGREEKLGRGDLLTKLGAVSCTLASGDVLPEECHSKRPRQS